MFAVHRIDEQLAKAMDRKVWLPSGGTLVIDRTEAMTVVDVNTGKFTGAGGNLEQTVTKNNLEAAEEIVRQLRLRDIGGIIVIDFIDMVLESNRDLVLRRLTEALARDRTRHQVSEVTSLGLVQLTRKRLGTGLIEAFSTNCTHCAGRGIVLHADPVDSASRRPARKAGVRRRQQRPARQARQEGRQARRGRRRHRRGEGAAAPAGEHPMFKAMAAANGRPRTSPTTPTTRTSKSTTTVTSRRRGTCRRRRRSPSRLPTNRLTRISTTTTRTRRRSDDDDESDDDDDLDDDDIDEDDSDDDDELDDDR